MVIALSALLAGALFLYFGAAMLIRGSSTLARSLGIAPAVIGLTVVAFGTSLPELVVTLTAAVRGSADLALGNVVGSNIANIGLILGAAASLHAIDVETAQKAPDTRYFNFGLTCAHCGKSGAVWRRALVQGICGPGKRVALCRICTERLDKALVRI